MVLEVGILREGPSLSTPTHSPFVTRGGWNWNVNPLSGWKGEMGVWVQDQAGEKNRGFSRCFCLVRIGEKRLKISVIFKKREGVKGKMEKRNWIKIGKAVGVVAGKMFTFLDLEDNYHHHHPPHYENYWQTISRAVDKSEK